MDGQSNHLALKSLSPPITQPVMNKSNLGDPTTSLCPSIVAKLPKARAASSMCKEEVVDGNAPRDDMVIYFNGEPRVNE